MPADPTLGLTAAEVAERVADGRVNEVPRAPSRTLTQIVRANVVTPVNGIVGVLFVLILVARGGPSADMLFAGVIVANSVIGTVQELRARAALNRLAVLQAPEALALRDGTEVHLEVGEVVADDLLVLRPGDQVVVDGEVVHAQGLELNESLLTGESDAVAKGPGDDVLSGSFVAAGSGRYRATRIGADSYAASLAEEARRFTLVHSELRTGINRILKILMVLIPPIALLLLWRLLQVSDTWQEALTGVVAACVAMVPDGLVLLTSIAFMAGVITLARRNALLSELASVEMLARVDTLCLDKTGTITSGEIQATGLELLGAGDDAPARACLAALAASEPEPNATLAAIGAAHPDDPGWEVTGTVAFSSARKWSAASFARPDGDGPLAVYLGAPEYLAPGDAAIADAVEAQARRGRRVVLVARAAGLTGDDLPPDLRPLALVLLEDRVRPDAPEILGYFAEQGVALKVISGDHPDTVAAVARGAGVPGAAEGVDARTLPDDAVTEADADALGAALDANAVFGRVTPRQKQAMVGAMQARGHVVAMTGDGVNDVLALKGSDMGIAMGAGSPATRAVAQLVLLDDQFSVLPGALAEGRRVINSVERAANLFVYGSVYSVVTSLVIALVGTDYPYLPRHLTLVRTLSVGVPGLFLALAPDPRRARLGFLGRVARFAVPAGLIAGVTALTVYLVARADAGETLIEARSAATITLLGVGLAILLRLTGSLPPWRWALVGSMAGAILVVLAVPWLSEAFQLDMPPGETWAGIAVAVALAAVALHFVPVTADGGEVPPPPPVLGDRSATVPTQPIR